MLDPRVRKMAVTIVQYSLELQPGDKVVIRGPVQAAPLIREVYREALRAGAHPTVHTMLDGLNEILLTEGSEDQIGYLSDLDRAEVEHFDAQLGIQASANTKALTGVPPERMSLLQKAHTPVSARFMERAASRELRWCGTLFPTEAHAQDAGMSLSEYEDFVFGAMLLDHEHPAQAWQEVHEHQQHVIDYLSQHDTFHIVAPDTDLTYRAGGRTWINSSGKRNFPSGEVFTGPIEDSVEGHIRFSYPAVYGGREVEDVLLVFHEGKVVEATAARGEEFLRSMLDTDPGARYVGEVAFGLNYGIQQFTRNILFDEKIGGTMHMALGRSYPDTGGQNESAIHWDMVCDLREGKVWADGELCYEQGKFIV